MTNLDADPVDPWSLIAKTGKEPVRQTFSTQAPTTLAEGDPWAV